MIKKEIVDDFFNRLGKNTLDYDYLKSIMPYMEDTKRRLKYTKDGYSYIVLKKGEKAHLDHDFVCCSCNKTIKKANLVYACADTFCDTCLEKLERPTLGFNYESDLIMQKYNDIIYYNAYVDDYWHLKQSVYIQERLGSINIWP